MQGVHLRVQVYVFVYETTDMKNDTACILFEILMRDQPCERRSEKCTLIYHVSLKMEDLLPQMVFRIIQQLIEGEEVNELQ